jgi:hypothetical protein
MRLLCTALLPPKYHTPGYYGQKKKVETLAVKSNSDKNRAVPSQIAGFSGFHSLTGDLHHLIGDIDGNLNGCSHPAQADADPRR